MPEKKILLVEDDFTISFFTKSLLEKKGFSNVMAVASGEEAIEAAASFKPDIILMDIILEGEIDGITAAKKIQEKMNVSIVYMSATTDNYTLDKIQATKSAGFIKKPFMPVDLFNAIEKALNIKLS